MATIAKSHNQVCLSQQPWLSQARDRPPPPLLLTGPAGEQQALRPQARISSNNQLSLQQMCVAGLGLALLTRIDADDDLRAGRLQQVLPQWTVPPLPAWAVTPQRDAQPAKVRHAVQALQTYLLTQPGVTP